MYRIGLDLEWKKSTARHHPVGGTPEKAPGERHLEHWRRAESFACGSDILSPEPSVSPADPREPPAVTWGRFHLPGCVFFRINTLLVKPTRLLSKPHLHPPERNTEPLSVKVKVLWQRLPLLLVSTANRELPSFRLKLHIFFFPLFYFQSWQPHESGHSQRLRLGCGAPRMGPFWPSWPPFPLTCLCTVYY